MPELSFAVLLVKIAMAVAGSIVSLAILQAKTRWEIGVRFSVGSLGGVLVGQWHYRHLYMDLEFVFWEAMMGCIFLWSVVAYFVLAAAARTFAGFENLADALKAYRDVARTLSGSGLDDPRGEDASDDYK